ncbi:MAG: oxygenase MpaB family protein [Rhizomicrobium sp.]
MTDTAATISSNTAKQRPSSYGKIDFTTPKGEPALTAPDSVSWQVFKNPVSLFIGGITAVLLEFAEPGVRSGVWDHSSFRREPLARMQRTGLAAMLTVYGPRSKTEAMIAGVRRMHARVVGTTPDGTPYHANDTQLLDWVQATASFGFLEAYSAFVRPVSDADKDKFYAEAAPSARLYGATGAPTSRAELNAQFEAIRPKLERSDIVFEFLDIMLRTPILPGPLKPVQRMLVRAAVEITPQWVRDILGLGPEWSLKPWEARLIRIAGALADRIPVLSSPPSQSCRRMGLSSFYLYTR